MKKIICPNCGSREVIYAGSKAFSLTAVPGSTQQAYYCKNCGYEGFVVVEVEEKEVDKIKKKLLNLREVKIEKGLIKSNFSVLVLLIVFPLILLPVYIPLFLWYSLFTNKTFASILAGIFSIIIMFIVYKYYILPRRRS